MTDVLVLKVTLQESEPPIWRRVEVRSDITLDELHIALQAAFDWQNGHQHTFDTSDGRRYGNPRFDPDFLPERGVPLTQLAPVGSTLEYRYDFGADWEVVIDVEKSAPADPGVTYPRCTAGRRAAPPEDIGDMEEFEFLVRERESAAIRAARGEVDEPDPYDVWRTLPEDFEPYAFAPEEMTMALVFLRA